LGQHSDPSSDHDAPPKEPEQRDRSKIAAFVARHKKAIAGVFGAVGAAALGVIVPQLIGTAERTIGGQPNLVSYSANEQIVQCGTTLFVPGSRARSGNLRVSVRSAVHSGWPAFKRSTGASVASPGVVTVSILGETSRTVTLTGINFTVIRRLRPEGGAFAAPCGDSLQGRFVEADLDQRPAAIVASSREPHGIVGQNVPGHRPNKPIAFPWTVSVTDPLLLDIVTTTKQCFCTWKADISWQSGDKSGVIRVDNGGKGYPVVGAEGVPSFLQGNTSWQRFKGALGSLGGGD
jgi:hypothetical protein